MQPTVNDLAAEQLQATLDASTRTPHGRLLSSVLDMLRDYQRAAVAQIVEHHAAGDRVLYCGAVGSGKTYVACGVMAAVPGRVLVLAHRVELLGQMQRAMIACGIDAGRVTPLSPGRAARLSDADLASFALVVVDEAHRAGGPTYSRLLARMPKARVLGLSASPYRREGLRGEFDAMVEGPSVAELVEAGHVVEPQCWSVPEEREADLRGVATSRGDYAPGELERRMNRPHLVGDIVREWREHAEGRSTLVFASGVKHAGAIEAAFRAEGIDARLVHGGTADAQRDRLIRDFDAGRFPVLVNVLLLTEGLDVHRVDALVLARPTRSIVLFVQALGRAMRPSPTGLTPIVLDHSGAVRAHGLPTMLRAWSLDPAPRGERGAAREMAKRCGACGTMAHLSVTECAACGASFRVEAPEERLEEVRGPKTRTCRECGIGFRPTTNQRSCNTCKRRCACGAPVWWGGATCREHRTVACVDCGTHLSRTSTTGRCRNCYHKSRIGKKLPPAWKEKVAAKLSARMKSQSPEERAERIRKLHAGLTTEKRKKGSAKGIATYQARLKAMDASEREELRRKISEGTKRGKEKARRASSAGSAA